MPTLSLLHSLISCLIRLFLYAYLLLQLGLSLYFTLWAVFFAALEFGSPGESSSFSNWVFVACCGLAFASSYVVLKGLLKRMEWVHRRGRVLSAAYILIVICLFDILRDPDGYTVSDFSPVNYPPLTMNILILGVLIIKPLYRYIFGVREYKATS